MDSFRRNLALAAAFTLALGAFGCGTARNPAAPQGGGTGLQLTVEQVTVDASRHVVVTYRLANGAGQSRDGTGVENRWTLAQLGADPSGVPAYIALIRTGQTVTVDGVTDKQPGFETNGAVASLGGGRFTYTYATQLPEGYDPAATYRVGVFSRVNLTPGATPAQYDPEAPNVVTDFVPAGGTPQKREVVAAAGCNACHVEVRAHGDFRRGTQICTTCHTFQLYDPDTKDPANPTQPNPLDFGRLVHRIHRGNDLPTVAAALSAAGAATGAAQTAILADPQSTYEVIGFQGSEAIFGGVPRPGTAGQPQVLVENGIARLHTVGVNFPQDIRHCAACHRPDAEDSAEIFNDASKRTCQGCHDDIVFDSATVPTAPSGTTYYSTHPAVPGFPFTGTTPAATCNVCHGVNGAIPTIRVSAIHVDPRRSAAYNGLVFAIVDVANAAPGQNPTVTFDVADKNGPITDLKVLDSMSATMSGPTHEFSYLNGFQSRSIMSTSGTTKTVNATPVAGTAGRYQIAFANRADGTPAIPANASGTWAFSLEGRRINTTITASERANGHLGATANFYDIPNNPVTYVGLAGAPVEERRTVVSIDRCNACHDVLSLHGGNRNDTKYCVFCHTSDATDWAQRPKTPVNGVSTVNVAATPDGIEEQSIHLKNMIHRIHTGEDLEVTRPFVIFGFRGSVNYFDDIRVPPLARQRCTSCHEADTYTVEAVPADAAPTVANETATPMHAGTAQHVAGEPVISPIRSACLGCHDTQRAKTHADAFSSGPTERCRDCHSDGKVAAVKTVHPFAP